MNWWTFMAFCFAACPMSLGADVSAASSGLVSFYDDDTGDDEMYLSEILDKPTDRLDELKEYYISFSIRRNEPPTILESIDNWDISKLSNFLTPSWSFYVSEFIYKDGRQYAFGHFVDGRGNPVDGSFYVVTAEWSCSLYRD
ncbi:MAG: hypothetical protein AB7N54_14255 [Alphaproteobacteria bacterium]